MNRLVFAIVALLAVSVGLLVGTLNAEPALLDLLWLKIEWPLGLLLLLFFAGGLLLGLLLVYFSQILPLRLKLRRSQAQSHVQPAPPETPLDD